MKKIGVMMMVMAGIGVVVAEENPLGKQFPVKVYGSEGGVVDAEAGCREDGKSVTFKWTAEDKQPIAVYDYGGPSVGGYAVFRVTDFKPQAKNAAGKAVGNPVLRISYCTHPQGLRETGDFTRRRCIDYLGKTFDNPVLPANVNRFELYTISRTGVFVAPLLQGQERYLRVQLDTPGTSVSVDAFEIRNTGVFAREEPVGSFRCSDERVNRAWDMGAWTCRIASFPNNDAWRVVAGMLLPRKLEHGTVAGFAKDKFWTGDGAFGATYEMARNPHYAGGFGLMLRAKDDTDGVIVAAEEPAVMKIYRRKGGVNTLLVQKVIDEPIGDGVKHRLEAMVKGTTVTAVFDGEPIIAAEVNDMALQGRIGLYVEKEWWPMVYEVDLADGAGKEIYRDDFKAADNEGRLPGWEYTTSFKFIADGAKRDRLVWLGDLWWCERTCFYAYEPTWPYLREALKLFAYNQNPEGYIWAAPFSEKGARPQSGEFGHFPSDEFSAWMVPVTWDYYLHTKDEASMAELYPAVRGELGYLRTRCTDEGLFVQRIETSSRIVSMPPKDPKSRLYTQIVLWKAFSDGAKLAEALGKGEDAAEWRAFAAKMSAAARKYYWSEKLGDFIGVLEEKAIEPISGDMVMASGFATKDEAKVIAKRIPKIGISKVHALAIRGMFEYGYDETAFDMLSNGNWYKLSDPNWEGAQCCTECGYLTRDGVWDESHPDTSVSGMLTTYILGIEPTEPGYRSFRFAPHLVPQLKFAEGRVPTPHGFVEAKWEKCEGDVKARLTVPEGTAAKVEFVKAKRVMVDGEKYEGGALKAGVHEIVAEGVDDEALRDEGLVTQEKAGEGCAWYVAPPSNFMRSMNPNAAFEAVFNLGAVRDLKAVEYTCADELQTPRAIDVSVSADGENWVDALQLTDLKYPGKGKKWEWEIRTAGSSLNGRYVKFVLRDLKGYTTAREPAVEYRMPRYEKIRIKHIGE